jgi:cytidyltransferase-like protein
MADKTVLVSGCFDLLHAGHIAFLEEAASYGHLHVAVGSDENLELLKGTPPHFSVEERLYILRSLKSVHDAFVASGSGVLDFEPDLEKIKPDFFVVNRDGHSEEKRLLCEKHGVVYVVRERIPRDSLPARSSSEIKRMMRFPFRLSIAGGWIDQPWVSEICPGSMVVASLYPTIEFNDRSGMATSSRKIAIELWDGQLPQGDPERMAQLLFGAENPPGNQYVAGSQDQIGLLVPGISRLLYDGKYWPHRIENTRDRQTCEWLESVIHLIPLSPRPMTYNPLEIKNLEFEWVKKLGESGALCYRSILNRDVVGLGDSLNLSLECWQRILPLTVEETLLTELRKYGSHPGATFSGCGGGYNIVASDKEIEGALKTKIRY